jgi:hypothetical protein
MTTTTEKRDKSLGVDGVLLADGALPQPVNQRVPSAVLYAVPVLLVTLG